MAGKTKQQKNFVVKMLGILGRGFDGIGETTLDTFQQKTDPELYKMRKLAEKTNGQDNSQHPDSNGQVSKRRERFYNAPDVKLSPREIDLINQRATEEFNRDPNAQTIGHYDVIYSNLRMQYVANGRKF